MKVEKFKHKATILTSTGGRLDVNLFLGESSETHTGYELFVDVLNSDSIFIPMEDVFADEILLIGKSQIMGVELAERNLMPETLEAPQMPVLIELVNGEMLEGDFYIEMPPDKSRLSDFLNFTPQFIYLCRDSTDFILNKAYILSVKNI